MLNEGEAIGPAVGELKSEGCENILIVYCFAKQTYRRR
jgi:hypothetical protein